MPKQNKRYYIAYGSNLNIRQMYSRCPDARLIGTARLDGWALHFRKSVTGYYLNIEPKKGGAVPVAVWQISEADERRLDRCEGFPDIYHKREMTLDIEGIVTGKIRRRRAFAYIMNEGRPIGKPAYWYVMRCLQGYDSFGFDVNILADAYASMSPPTKEFYKLLMEGRIQHGGNPILRWMAGNVVVDTDPAGNIKCTKAKSPEKIDGIVAAIMALDRCIRQANQSSVYDDPEHGLWVF